MFKQVLSKEAGLKLCFQSSMLRHIHKNPLAYLSNDLFGNMKEMSLSDSMFLKDFEPIIQKK